MPTLKETNAPDGTPAIALDFEDDPEAEDWRQNIRHDKSEQEKIDQESPPGNL